MTDEIKLRKMEWSEISDLRTKANIKAHEANSAWRAALDINTLGKSEEESMAAHSKRISTLAEYQKCHAEALRISEIANSMYIDKAGSDVEFYRKNPFQSGNPVIY
jgi:hypothetical protein